MNEIWELFSEKFGDKFAIELLLLTSSFFFLSFMLNNHRFDVIFANIHKNIIISDLPKYFSVLSSGGSLHVSGFYLDDLDDVEAVANNLGLKLVSRKVKNNWCSALFM